MNDLYWFSFKNPKCSDFGSKNAKWKINSESPKLYFQKIQDISFILAKTVWKNLSYFASKVQKPDFSKNERFEVFEIVTL